MTDPLEAELRITLNECADLMPAYAVERLSRIDYWPRSRRSRKQMRVWSLASAVGVAVAGCAIAAMLVFSSSSGPLGVPMAYAGWSATPVTPAPVALAAAVAACNKIDSWNLYSGTPRLIDQPVVTDARGKYVAAVYVSGSQVNYCISDGHAKATGTGGGDMSSYAPPGADQLGLPLAGGGPAPGFPGANPNERIPRGTRKTIEGTPEVKNNPGLLAKVEAAHGPTEYHLLGRAGSDITGATFVFANNKTVTATVQNGWYFVWWPNRDQPISVQVTTTSGSTINSPWRCKTGVASCVFAGTIPPPLGATTIAPRPPVGVPTKTTPGTATTTKPTVTANP